MGFTCCTQNSLRSRTIISLLNRHPVLALLGALAASYVLATLSWFVLEKPFLKLKHFFASKPAPREGADGRLATVAP